jgi:hypothetical protein
MGRSTGKDFGAKGETGAVAVAAAVFLATAALFGRVPPPFWTFRAFPPAFAGCRVFPMAAPFPSI